MTGQFVKDVEEAIAESTPVISESRYQDGRYTISFINGNPGLVIRGDTKREIKQAMDEILPLFKTFKNAIDTKRERQEQDATPPPGGQTNQPTCGIHGTKMEWKTGVSKKTNKPYAFWGCPTKNADGSFCQYKPE